MKIIKINLMGGPLVVKVVALMTLVILFLYLPKKEGIFKAIWSNSIFEFRGE